MKLKKIFRIITESYFEPDFRCEEFATLYINNILKINPENIGMYLSQDWDVHTQTQLWSSRKLTK